MEKKRIDVVSILWDMKQSNLHFDTQIALFLENEIGLQMKYETDYFIQVGDEFEYSDNLTKHCSRARTTISTQLSPYITDIEKDKIKTLLKESWHGDCIISCT